MVSPCPPRRIRRAAFLLPLAVSFVAISLVRPAAAGARPSPPPSAAAPHRPNILLITIDTLRYDRISFHVPGHARTPALDELARRSAVFTRAYAHNPLTRPSHTNILTGTTPLYHGVSDNPGFRLENGYLTLAEHLKAHGYLTGAFIGAFVLDSRFGLDRGFDVYDDGDAAPEFGEMGSVERRADEVVRRAEAWIARQGGTWFCWIHVFDPHDPYAPPEPFRVEYASDPYSGEVAYVDSQLGGLFNALKVSGALDRTAIVLTADHGEALGEKEELRHGFFAYDNVLHVPLFVAGPGLRPAKVAENASHVDIFPTVCELAGLPVPAHIQGESLLRLAAGGKRRRTAIYFESMSPHLSMDAAPLSGFIEGDIKFIDLPLKEVYDLAWDPAEEKNLASTTDVAALTAKLEGLKKSLKGKGTTQDLKAKNPEIRPLMESLGYDSGKPIDKRTYGKEDDPKVLYPQIAQLRLSLEDFKAGRPAEAIKKLTTILRIRPIHVNAWAALADIQYNLGRNDQAEASLISGLEANPDSLALRARLGALRLMAHKFAEAVADLEFATKGDPWNPDTLNYLGMAYLGSQRFEQSEAALNKALALDPGLAAAYNNLGYLHMALYVKTRDAKRLDEAVRFFDQALARRPGLPSALRGKEAAAEYKSQFGEIRHR